MAAKTARCHSDCPRMHCTKPVAERYELAKAMLRNTEGWRGMRWYNTYTRTRTLKVLYFTPWGTRSKADKARIAANSLVHATLSKLADSVSEGGGPRYGGVIYHFSLERR